MSSISYAELRTKTHQQLISWIFLWTFTGSYHFDKNIQTPWTVAGSESIPKVIFHEWYEAIKDRVTEFRRTLEKRKNKRKKTASYIIQFTHLGRFKYHFGEITRKDKVILEKVNATTKEKILMRSQ